MDGDATSHPSSSTPTPNASPGFHCSCTLISTLAASRVSRANRCSWAGAMRSAATSVTQQQRLQEGATAGRGCGRRGRRKGCVAGEVDGRPAGTAAAPETQHLSGGRANGRRAEDRRQTALSMRRQHRTQPAGQLGTVYHSRCSVLHTTARAACSTAPPRRACWHPSAAICCCHLSAATCLLPRRPPVTLVLELDEVLAGAVPSRRRAAPQDRLHVLQALAAQRALGLPVLCLLWVEGSRAEVVWVGVRLGGPRLGGNARSGKGNGERKVYARSDA